MVRAQKQGISLIVLILTIIVVIILAAVVVLTLTKNNPIESAKEARFKNDVRTFQDELAMTVSKQFANSGGKRDTKINADKYTKDGAEDSVYTYIPSFKDKYNNKFVIQDDELRYTNKVLNDEKEWSEEINVKEASLLPSAFQQVEYIENIEKQYINTLFFADQDTSIWCECVIIDTFKSGYYQGLFGATTNNGSKELNRNVVHMHRKDASNLVILAAYGDEVGESSSYRGNINQKHTYKLEKNVFKVDDNIIYSYNYKNFKCDKTLNIFRDNNTCVSQDRRYCLMKLYSFKIFDDDILVRDYIPCYCTKEVTDVNGNTCESGTVGLYDLVKGEFYTNQGTGKFDVGPDV